VNNDIKGLDTKANRHEGQSDQELALIVNSALKELLEEANRQKKQAKQISTKELVNMKKAYDAASAFTAMVNKTFNKSIPYKDFELMNEVTINEVKSKNQANNKQSRGNSEDLKSDDSYDDDKPPPPSKKQKSGFKSVITASHEESNNDNKDNDNIDNDDNFEEDEEHDGLVFILCGTVCPKSCRILRST
jgi:hypothetical protein